MNVYVKNGVIWLTDKAQCDKEHVSFQLNHYRSSTTHEQLIGNGTEFQAILIDFIHDRGEWFFFFL